MHTVFPPQVHVQLPLSSREVTPSKRQKKEGSKRAPVRTKLRKVQHVPLDEAGKPILPLQLGIITIYKLGEIVYDRRQFHSERYIYPVGYTVTRMYSSMIDPSKTVLYTCTITDGGDGPRFHVTPDDAPDRGVTASTATGAWTSIIRVANAIRQRDHSNSASGPDYFGFSHPTVAKLIQDLPNADKCESYVWQKFEEIKGRGTKRVNAKINKIPTLPSASPLAQSIGIPATPTNGQHYLLPSANYQPLPSNRIADMLSSPKGGSDVPDWSETGSAMMDDAKSTIYSRDTSPLIGPLGTSSVLSDDGLSGHGEDEDEDLMSDVAIGGIAVGPVDTGNESEGE
ncbi:F/Y-rich N-terminus-domain-containing protein [Phlyctochytrium arcticum]|nr:F/Y-rich N-terminus-domain-containing protein [Phlyctochytrium arcticum]